MGSGVFVPTAVAWRLRSTLLRVGLVLGLGFVFLVFLPVSAAVAVSLAGGSGSLALGLLAAGLLGFLLVLAAIPVALVALVWVLLGAATAAVGSYVTERRLRVLDWAANVEATRWWGPFVRPTARLAFVDPLSEEERLDAALDRTKSAYVSGALSEAGLERRLDEVFGIEPGGFTSERPEASHTRTAPRYRDGLREEAPTEQSIQ